MDKLLDVTQMDHKVKRQEREPQSEAEEVTADEPTFKKAIIKETEKFLEALRLFELVQVGDLEKLKDSRVNTIA